MNKQTLEIQVRKAIDGDKDALEYVIIHIKDYVYNLSLKMLLFPEDAKDATQEILIKIITHLSSFQFNAQFMTWVYRISTNFLLSAKSRRSKNFTMSFDEYSTLIDTGQSELIKHAKNEGEIKLLEEEVKVSCTQGLLLCLNPVDRMVFILAEILDFGSVEGGAILGLTPENYRQKRSRSRKKIQNFLQRKCGLADPKNPCRCTKKIDFLINQEKIDPSELKFATLKERSIDLIEKIDHLDKSLAIYKSVPKYRTPDQVISNIKTILNHA